MQFKNFVVNIILNKHNIFFKSPIFINFKINLGKYITNFAFNVQLLITKNKNLEKSFSYTKVVHLT